MLESDYQVVKIISAQGQRLAVDLAQADSDTNHATTLGVVTETIQKNQEGFVTINGLVREIDTTGTLQGETWYDGDTLYLSPYTAGELTKIKPQAPQHTVRVAYVVYAHSVHGKIYIAVDIGYELEELHNVKDTSTTSSYGDLLVKSGSLWINSRNLTGSYILSGSINTSNGITSSLYGTSSFANYSLSSSYAPTNSNITASYLLPLTQSIFINGDISASVITASIYGGTLSPAITKITGSTTLTNANYTVLCSASISTFNVILPAANTIDASPVCAAIIKSPPWL